MPMRSRSVALLRHLARPRAASSLTTAAASTAPHVTVASIRRELSRLQDLGEVKAKVDESRRLYDRFSRRIFPAVVAVLLIGEWNQDTSIKELMKKSVAMLKEEKVKAASATTASSSAMPAACESESEPTVANGMSCVGGST